MTGRRDFLGPDDDIGANSTLTQAIWCDRGEHAFSAKDPDRQHFTQTQEVKIATGNSYGSTVYQDRKQITNELDICGPCWKGADMFKGSDKSPLELEDESYRRGYEAAMDRAIKAGGQQIEPDH